MRRKRDGGRREKITMIISSVCVLAVLTAVGLFARDRGRQNNDGYVVDFSAMEKEARDLVQNQPEEAQNVPVPQEANNPNVLNPIGVANGQGESELGEMASAQGMKESAVTENDLDYDPAFREANSAQAENQAEDKQDGETEQKEETEEAENTMAISTSASIQPALSFDDEDTLAWPVVGNVLINYSMDKTVYFPTLDQYKYNPAIVIAAVEGESITAAASGKVKSVSTDPELGNVVVMELGSGYEITYGQLKDITVSEGGYVSRGDLIGSVAAPTKYYSVEGCNIYLKLTKDGTPVDPMAKLD